MVFHDGPGIRPPDIVGAGSGSTGKAPAPAVVRMRTGAADRLAPLAGGLVAFEGAVAFGDELSAVPGEPRQVRR
ncbi:hypothetical protein [Streptomyces sp. NPDC050485]|uniref:hypothetical protein n=1 Tax=Streptomyces sp. NPDC050485 TaxID=3365617 RepID=UPI0037B076D5